MKSFVPFPKEAIEQSIPSRFEGQVEAHGHSLAVKTRNHKFTYESLNQYANRIASTVLNQFDEDEALVVLLCDHDAPLIAAILGVLKAGKTYIPLDTLDPHARLSQVIDNLNCPLIITDNNNLSVSNGLNLADTEVLNIEDLDTGLSEKNPGLTLNPDFLAYIYFTSGSTGLPKGVMDNHRNVLHNIMRYTNSLKICRDDRLTLLQSPRFSGYVSSLFGALLNGASVFPFDIREEDVERLPGWINREGITIYHSVPILFRHALNKSTRSSNLRMIRLEGDQSSTTDVELFKKFSPPECTLVNGLGTTETGICRQFFIQKDSKLPNDIVPIGYPVEDMEIKILDDEGNEVGHNQTGEIAVKSHYLSLGYWNESDLTKAAFKTDAEEGSARIYNTGDFGRMQEDGCLDYLGRISANNNINRQTLPGPITPTNHSKTKKQGPQSPMEELVFPIWSEVLGCKALSRNDDFFSMNGESLKALQVMSRINRLLSTPITLRDLFERPVLADFAKFLETSNQAHRPEA